MRRRVLLLKKVREQRKRIEQAKERQIRRVQTTPFVETGEMTFGYEEEF